MIFTLYEIVAQSSATFPVSHRHARQSGRGFEALAQTLARTAILFVKKNLVPAARRTRADLFVFAVPEVGEVVSGRKSLCERCWNKKSSKTVRGERGEKSLSVTLEKIVRKPVALTKTVLTNKKNVNQSNCFRYGTFTNSSLEISDKDPVFEKKKFNLIHEKHCPVHL